MKLEFDVGVVQELFISALTCKRKTTQDIKQTIKDRGFFTNRYYVTSDMKEHLHKTTYYRFISSLLDEYITDKKYTSMDSRLVALLLDMRHSSIINLRNKVVEKLQTIGGIDYEPYPLVDDHVEIDLNLLLMIIQILVPPTISHNSEKVIVRRAWIFNQLISSLEKS